MFPMTITVHDQAELNAVMAALVGTFDAVAPAQEPEEKKSTRTSAKKADKPAAEAKAGHKDADAQTDASDAASTTAQSAATGDAVSYEQAAAAVKDLAKKNRDEAVAVLAKFGAKRLTEVKPAQFADVLAACQAALEA